MEHYGNEVGLAALEWCDVMEPDYRRSTLIGDDEWFSDVSNLVYDKWTSQSPSLSGDDQASSPWLNCVGWQDKSLVES